MTRGGIPLRLGEAGAGELRQPAQSQARHAVGRRRRARAPTCVMALVLGAAAASSRSWLPANYFSSRCRRWRDAGIVMNIVFVVLNLFPILPLDGGRIARRACCRNSARVPVRQIEPYGLIFIVAARWSRGVLERVHRAARDAVCRDLIYSLFGLS